MYLVDQLNWLDYRARHHQISLLLILSDELNQKYDKESCSFMETA
jgi:hypothetical protein